MSSEQNKVVLRRWMEGWNTRDPNVMEALTEELTTADYVLHDPSLGGGSLMGPSAIKRWARDVLKNTPDTHVTVEDLVAEGDKVAAHVTVRGTDAATGKPVNLRIISIVRIVGDRVAEAWQLAVPAA